MGKLQGHTTYLAGPMEHVNDNGVSWREEIKPFLFDLGIGVFDPCDKPTDQGLETMAEREEYQRVKGLVSLYRYTSECEYYLKKMHEMCKEIVSIDLRLVDLSSFLIMHVNKDVHMCGTYAEFTHARLQRKPVIVKCDQGIEDLSGFIHGLGQYAMFFDSWNGVKDYVAEVDRIGSDIPSWKFFDYNKVYGKKLFV
jgi:hypothetical protein